MKILVLGGCGTQGRTAIVEATLAAFGRLDALVNNASTFYPTPVGTITEEHWNDLVGSNFKAPLFLSQALSVTLYAYGLAESLRFVWADLPVQPVTFGVILVVAVLAYIGAERALKAQLPLLLLVFLSILERI